MGYNDMFLEEVQFVTAQALQPFKIPRPDC